MSVSVYTGIGSGDQERKRGHNNFPDPRYNTPRIHFKFQSYLVGQVALDLVYIRINQVYPDDVITTCTLEQLAEKLKRARITSSVMEDFIIEYCPNIFWVYDRYVHESLTIKYGKNYRKVIIKKYGDNGKEWLKNHGKLNGRILMYRFYNMFRINKERRFVMGPEHPKICKPLIPVLRELNRDLKSAYWKVRYGKSEECWKKIEENLNKRKRASEKEQSESDGFF